MSDGSSGRGAGQGRTAPDLRRLTQVAGQLIREQRLTEAQDALRKVLQTDPRDFEALYLQGKLVYQRKQLPAAIELLRKALRQNPRSAEAHFTLGNVLADLRQYEESVASYRQAITIRPGHGEAHYNLGIAFSRLEMHQEAIDCYRRTLEIKPDLAAAHNNLGHALCALNRYRPAIASYRRALEIAPGYANAHYNLGVALTDLKRYPAAMACFRHALASDPAHAGAFSMLAQLGRQVCDWSHDAEAQRELTDRIRKRRGIVNPFTFLGFSEEPEDQFRCARAFAGQMIKIHDDDLDRPVPRNDGRIRIAYQSANFGEHPVAHLMAEIFELHDRDRFEISAISLGPDDGSVMRRRLGAAFDHFLEARNKSDRAVARMIADMGIDIVIDTNGYTTGCRPGILAHRPAPVQVNYLGFTGTMGTNFIDYILVDRFVAPPQIQDCFSERLVWLPDCYQANDRKRPIAAKTPTRREVGLPDEAFVFCSFNNAYKITPVVFDLWMRLLRAIPGSVLWLSRDNEAAVENLRKAAEHRNVSPDRLVFAPRLKARGDHLARQRLADLFLDTFPYNAHTTASDALWAGLPVVTFAGRTFASRVAGSLLNAVGLAELVTHSLDEYESLALRLAQVPGHLADLRRKLVRERDSAPLFDSERFCRHLEAAYTRMVGLVRDGRAPESFAVSETD